VQLNPEVANARDTLMQQFQTRQRQQQCQMSYPGNTDSGNWDSASQEDFDYESITGISSDLGSAGPGAQSEPYTPTWHADGRLPRNKH